MSEILTKVVVDCSTGEQQVLPLTPEEIAGLEAAAANHAEQQSAREAEAAAKESARQSGIAKLLALGLTEEEANALSK
jgi:hypothetical protein